MLYRPDQFVARSLDESRPDPGRTPDSGSGGDGDRAETEAQRLRAQNRCRTKMISFRVSDREFEMLRQRSEADGARNISEYARTALCEGPRPSDSDIRRLSSEIQQLGADVARVTELIEHGSARVKPETPERDPE
ncbi:MAG: hypothetical protein ABIX28_01165 [Vicinamibacterales bacterium]